MPSLTVQPSSFNANATLTFLKFTARSTVLGACLSLPAQAILSAFLSCCVFSCSVPFPSLFHSFILLEIFTAQVEHRAGEHSSRLLCTPLAAGPSCFCRGTIILPRCLICFVGAATSRLAGTVGPMAGTTLGPFTKSNQM